MTDFEGRELNVGDSVAYIYTNGCKARHLCRGIIKEIKGNLATIEDSYYSINELPDTSQSRHFSPSWSQPVRVKSCSIIKA